MGRIGSKNTAPELIVRRLLHSLGYRFRLHRKDLPGTPDIVLPGRRKAIFVHGCFWHQHQDPTCPLQTHPKSHTGYWKPKLRCNRERDRINERELTALGWKSLAIWECELHDTSHHHANQQWRWKRSHHHQFKSTVYL